jgi:hypothetical protein
MLSHPDDGPLHARLHRWQRRGALCTKHPVHSPLPRTRTTFSWRSVRTTSTSRSICARVCMRCSEMDDTSLPCSSSSCTKSCLTASSSALPTDTHARAHTHTHIHTHVKFEQTPSVSSAVLVVFALVYAPGHSESHEDLAEAAAADDGTLLPHERPARATEIQTRSETRRASSSHAARRRTRPGGRRARALAHLQPCLMGSHVATCDWSGQRCGRTQT